MVDSILELNLGGKCQSKEEVIKLARQHSIDTGHRSIRFYNQYKTEAGLMLIVGLDFVCEEEKTDDLAHRRFCGRSWSCSLEEWRKPYENPYAVCDQINRLA